VLSRGYLSPAECDALRAEVDAAVAVAPFFTPRMRNGAAFRVQCTNMGSLGWCADPQRGYHYSPVHPVTRKLWPAIPNALLRLWREFVGYEDVMRDDPECCLVNRYAANGRLGMHRDTDEAAVNMPVISVSLGASAVFRIGGLRSKDPSEAIALDAGDVLMLAGESRHMYHGVDRIEGAERLSLTLRRVTA
jgi:alkylated DNA repair protein (DNA oxidative demethylase)